MYVELQFDSNQLTVSTVSNLGEGIEQCALAGEASLKIGVHPRLFLAILENIDSEVIELEMKAPTSAIIIKPVDNDKHLCLIMPMQI